MRLIACQDCHTQFDVTRVDEPTLECHCGTSVKIEKYAPVDAEIRRCGSCGASVALAASRCDYCDSTIVRDSTRLSLICPECYMRNAEDSSFCARCGVEFQPQEIPEKAEELLCPCCSESAMHLRAIGGVPIQECSRCNGLWIPGSRFNALVKRAREAQKSRPSSGLDSAGRKITPATITQKVEYRKCPVCKKPMSRRNFARRSGVIVDLCPGHGTWLDGNELEQIASFVHQGGMERKRSASATGVDDYSKQLGMSAKQLEAMVWAETVLAEERAAVEKRRLQRHRGRVRTGSTLGDFLEDLLGF